MVSATEWPTLNVPEFNDCQRFIEVDSGGQRHYTKGYFAVFAFPDTTRLDVRARSHQGAAVPVAFIYAEDEAYPQLGINHGGNCLYLQRVGRIWKGFMSPAATGPTGAATCKPSIEAGVGTPLVVKSTHVGNLDNAGDYPNVARWDWDSQNDREYIGIRCGVAWCGVGDPDSLALSHAYPGRAENASQLARRTVLVKGWYDEQYLARCGGGPATCHPTALVGTIFPDPNLDRANTADYKGNWVPVARVEIVVDPSSPDISSASADLNSYKTKFNFDPTPANGPLNGISLCHGDRTACPGVPSTLSCPAPTPSSGETEHGLWWAKIVAAQTGDVEYRCITRRPAAATAPHVVGAVRWRWLLKDETNWIRCVQGCCEVQGA